MKAIQILDDWDSDFIDKKQALLALKEMVLPLVEELDFGMRRVDHHKVSEELWRIEVFKKKVAKLFEEEK